jgi:hypothetical protein
VPLSPPASKVKKPSAKKPAKPASSMGCAPSCCASDEPPDVVTERQRWQRKYRHLLDIAVTANAFSSNLTSDVAFRTVARLYAHEVSSRESAIWAYLSRRLNILARTGCDR